MSKYNVLSIVLGICILVTTVIMVIQVSDTAYEHSIHEEWSLGVKYAVRIMLSIYSVIICLLSTALVVVNLKVKKKENK